MLWMHLYMHTMVKAIGSAVTRQLIGLIDAKRVSEIDCIYLHCTRVKHLGGIISNLQLYCLVFRYRELNPCLCLIDSEYANFLEHEEETSAECR
jgi:hypothetical protein